MSLSPALSLSNIARELRHFAESVLDLHDADTVSVVISVDDDNQTIVHVRIAKSANTFVSFNDICTIGKKIAKTFRLFFAFDGINVDDRGIVLQYSSTNPSPSDLLSDIIF